MVSEQTSAKVDPYFGGFVLETLTIGMYDEPRNSIREYIQNAFDSIQKAIYELKILSAGQGRIDIELSGDHRSLTIRDNGAGIPAKVAVDVLTHIGASTKDHRRNAGFRGIGRLSGIVFSDTVTFTTKAKGERRQTTVVFDAKAMRAGMSPGRGSARSASQLLNDTVTAYTTPALRRIPHFLEVTLDGLRDAPVECLSGNDMVNFVSQVAPVPYSKDFIHVPELREAAKQSGIPVEEVNIFVREGQKRRTLVTKPYRATHAFESGDVPITECEIVRSKTNSWWGWIGKKGESGSYTDPRVAGLRVRVRNIQIDGTELIRAVFSDNKPSHGRFQSYFLGEIFVRPDFLVPNARRDGFERDQSWRTFFREMKPVARKLADEAYALSKQGTASLDAINQELSKLRDRIKSLQRAKFSNDDHTIELSRSITIAQRRIAKALQAATFDTSAELQAVSSELEDIKREALSHISGVELQEDREALRERARVELLQDLLRLLEDNLSPPCFAGAREAIRDEYDID